MYLYSIIFVAVAILLAAFIVGVKYAKTQITQELLKTSNCLPSKTSGIWFGLSLVAIAIIGIGSLIYLSNVAHQHDRVNQESTTTQKTANRQILYWIDPMEPTVHYSKGGTSPMGMTLEPVYAKKDSDNLPENAFKLPASYIDNLGVKTTAVISANSGDNFSAYAVIESNEAKISYVTSYANGWVRNLVAKTAQMPVVKGQLLTQIYSPVIINAENEYLTALNRSDQTLIAAAKNKLLSLHVDPAQIDAITKNKTVSQLINITAPQNGILTSLNIREGDYITPDKQLFTITDLSSVWLIANVFERQLSQIKFGMPISATINELANRHWNGKVDYIYPQVDDATRTVKVRIVLNNADLSLKPSMYGSVQFSSSTHASNLLIPSTAIIMSSSGNRVIVALESGVFQVRQVTIGNEVGDLTQINSGLNVGEQVVSEGEFMLDSEANLSAGLSRINASAPVAGHTHAKPTASITTAKMNDMNMDDMPGMDMSHGH